MLIPDETGQAFAAAAKGAGVKTSYVPEPPGSGPRGGNPVLTMIGEADLTPVAGLEEVTQLAAGAQRLLADRGSSDRHQLIRSTLLWALWANDPDVESAFAGFRSQPQDLAEILGLPDRVAPLVGLFQIDSNLQEALRRGLADRRHGEVITGRRLAEALVRSVVDGVPGLLEGRLRELRIDPARLLENLRSPSAASLAPLVRDVTPEEFGVAVPDDGSMPAYFRRDVDDRLDELLASRPPAVVVIAPAMSGAVRTVYEALRRTCADDRLVLAKGLETTDEAQAERLLLSGARLVWIPDLGDLARSSMLRDWFSRRRDLLRATLVAVVRPEDQGVASELGLDAVRVEMRSELTVAEREASQQRFGRTLTTIDEVVAASRPRRVGQAAYLADSYDAYGRVTAQNDALDIEPDVRMLASLVASRQVVPPLSVGLFGPWGSGKSFLMHQIKLGALDLADRSTRLPEGRSSAYCSKLVTVDFNAWQYVHGVDLWASLVSKVFEGLRDQLATTEAYQQLWKDIRERSTDVASAQHELDAAENDLRASSTNAEARDVASLAADDPQLEWSAATLKRTIDLDPASTAIRELRTEVLELRTVSGKLRKGWRGASPVRRAAVSGLAAAAGALVVWGLIADQDAVSTVAAAVPLIAALTAIIKPARLALGAGVEILEADRRRYDEARRRRDDAADALVMARSHGPAALYGYVSDRSVAADYRQHLGVGPMIREDLARLASLASEGEATIDRIVIFIDDLDRCPAKDVVRVLEAVNLLFAHELFVVVVAVDSRWLIESLKSEFSEVFTRDDTQAPTPQNYLEKIIQIPFWLQPVNKDAFGKLVTSLVGDVEDDRPPPVRADDRTTGGADDEGTRSGDQVLSHGPFHDDRPPSSAPVVPDDATSDLDPVPASAPDAEDSVPEVDLNPAALRLTAHERDYLGGFHELVTTPRATKRFLNTYQLLRSGIPDLEGYLAREEYKPVLLLLALVTGTGLVDHRMVEQLSRTTEGDFAAFLAARTSDANAWAPVALACQALPLELLTPDVITDWLSRVARYSFHPVGR